MRVIVFALNGLPAGWLGAYGNDWVGTPHLDRLAAEGVAFDRHVSDRPDPDAARRAWLGRSEEPTPPGPPSLKGRGEFEPSRTANELGAHPAISSVSPLPFREGGPGGVGSSPPPRTVLVRANHPDTDAPSWYYAGWAEVFDARPRPDDDSPLEELLRTLPTLLERLRDVPDFLLWIETDRLIPPWDVQQDVFEAYLDDAGDDTPPEAVDTEEDEPDAEDELVDEATDEAEEAESEDEADGPAPPVEPAEPVEPFADPPTGPFDRADLDAWDWLRNTFAAVVTKLDAELGAAFDLLRAEGLDQSAAWLVTSDFGYPLGEHGQVGLHRPWLHEELVHLPLLLRLPGAEQAGRRVAGFTQPPDVYPTICELLGTAPPADGAGFSLLPLARGEAESRRVFAASELTVNGAAEVALRTDEWALLVPTAVPDGDPPREPRLYAKPDDRWEVNDLRARNIERADELEVILRDELKKRSSLSTDDTDEED